MFASPFEHCPHCGECVLLDQTQRECAAEHRCRIERCPYARYFTGNEIEPVTDAPRRPPQ